MKKITHTDKGLHVHNKIFDKLINFLLDQIAVSEDSTKILVDQVVYFTQINLGELKNDHMVLDNVLVDENLMNVGDFKQLADLYLKDEDKFYKNRTIPNSKKETVEGLVLYSLYIVDLFKRVGDGISSAKIIIAEDFLDNPLEYYKFIAERKQALDEIVKEKENLVYQLKNTFLEFLVRSFNNKINGLNKDEVNETVTSQADYTKLFLETGNLKLLKKIALYESDMINCNFIDVEIVKNIYKHHPSLPKEDLSYLSDTNSMKDAGIALALIDYSSYLINKKKAIQPLQQFSTKNESIDFLPGKKGKKLSTDKKTLELNKLELLLGTNALKNCLEVLKDNNFIHKTTLTTFREAFSGKTGMEKIIWFPDATVSELRYFINKIKHNFVSKKNIRIRTINSFRKEDGEINILTLTSPNHVISDERKDLLDKAAAFLDVR